MTTKAPFFSRKNILAITVAVFLVYILFWVGAVFNNKLAHDRVARVIKSQQDAFNSLSKEEQAIRRGEQYLVSTITQARPNERLFLDYLQRKFDINKTLGVAGPPIDLSEDPKTYPLEIHFLARMAFPNKLVAVQPKDNPEGVLLTNIYSANCDHLPLPANFWETMEQNYRAGGYLMAHDALALAFMHDNGCSIPSSKGDLSERVVNGMLAIAGDPKTPQDLRYEAIAFLQLSGKYSQIKPEWSAQIASDQNEDGSWGLGGGDKNTQHTSILAMWALLEYSRPDTPYEPLIPRPTPKP